MRVLTEEQALALVSEMRIGRLGCVDNGEAYIVPISYLIEGGTIYSHSLPGRKIRALRTHPRACLQVDQVNDDLHWRSAIAFGHFGEVNDEVERAHVLRKLLERFPMLTPVESQFGEGAARPEVIVFRIRIERVTGMAED